MSVRRYQPEPRPPEHRSIEHPSDHDRPYHLRRFNRSRNRVNTKSLQSIELNRASTLLPQKNHSQRRKLLSLERNDPSEQATERAELQQSVRHLPAEPHAKPPHRPLRTIETGNLEARERRIKDCIQLMQGVLSEIQHQKSQKGGVAVAVTQAAGGECPEGRTVGSKEGSLSKFENYVRKVVNLRQDSKVIILRKAKTKSLIANNSAVRSTAILNAHRFDTIREAKPR
ncbi:hypothetical protein DAPPUDRAFT_344265 [Daphnia pulex]|uniref:Uncharacterized protein n=1 Tax=Daphnia pulex TaxID=6669 RepID=E9I6V3_DAPPU|nr:hypothetical protein DAPPUDRAFT_344265 [Daphnia pulex]|eukprot:EFX60277.1 hypothetical protein DAPPUDRAFT_344265 [Daphnia pulex]